MAVMTSYDHGQFSWVDLMTSDTDAAKKFYGELFGWSTVDLPTDKGRPYTICKLGEDEICGMSTLPPDMQSQGVPPMWNSYINVDDLEQAVARVESLGGTVTMPAMQVMEAGRMAGIADPSGGKVFLWQKNKHIGSGRVNDPGCFSWNELATRDIDAARAFYTALFGWQFEESPHAPSAYFVIKNGGRDNGGLMQMDDNWDANIPPHWSVYFTAENANAAAAQIEQHGGRIIAAPFPIPLGRIAVVSDPQGATFCLFEFGEGVTQP